MTMKMVLSRGILPVVMSALGIAFWFWGAKHHVQKVFEEQEIEITIASPELMLPPEALGGPALEMDGGVPPWAPPPPMLQKVKQIVLISKDEPEPRLVFEVTIGGLALLETGELQRTYRGAPPSLCPT